MGAESSSTCMIVLYSAGSNAHGQLSNGTCNDSHSFQECSLTSAADKCEIGEIIDIAGGANHSLVLLRTRNDSVVIWGCGDGSKGQLGPWYQKNILEESLKSQLRPLDLQLPPDATPRRIATAWESTYIAYSTPTGDDILLSMGLNDYGDLGIGQSNTAPLNLVRFDHVLASLDYKHLRIESLAAGLHHVVVSLLLALPNGSIRSLVVGWGTARHGQLGDIVGNNGKPLPFVATPHLVLAVGADDRVVSIGAGNQHTVVLLRSGTIHAIGSNRKFQLAGVPSFLGAKSIGCTWNGTYILRDGLLFSTGSHSKGQLGRIIPSQTKDIILGAVELPSNEVKQLAYGSEHILVHLATSSGEEIWGWGWNEHGNLGTGDAQDVTEPIAVWPSAESVGRVAGIWAGCGTSWIAVIR